MLRVTLVPTRASASDRNNVIPSLAEAVVDCRVPPGLSEADVRARIRRYRDAGITTLQAKVSGPDRLDTVAQLVDIVRDVSAE